MTKGLVRANNFSDLADKDEAVVNLGLSAADYAALKGLYTTAGIDFAVIGEIGNSQGNYQAQLDGISTTLSGVVLSGYVNRSGDTILGTWTHSGIINISSGLPSGYPASTDSLFSLSIESGEAVIVASGLIASGLSYNGVRQSSSTVQRAFPPSGFSPLHLIPLQVGGQSFFAEAGESPSFYIDPVGQGHALDLVTGNLVGTFSSASPAYAVNAQGILALPAANAPVIEYDPVTLRPLGLRVWQGVTNRIRNNTGQGAATGTPGTLPTNWSTSGFSGLTREVVAISSVNGIDYIDIRFSGTATGTFGNLALESVSSVAASNAQSWTASAWLQLVAGSFSGVGTRVFAAQQHNAANSYLSDATAGAMSAAIDATLTRINRSFTTNQATIASITPYLQFGFTNGAAIDFTLRIGLPQLEQSAVMGPVVKTTGTTASSTADVISITGGDFARIFNAAEGTLFAGFNAASSTASTVYLFSANQTASSANRIDVNINTSLIVNPRTVVSGAAVSSIAAGTYAPNSNALLSYGYGVANYASSLNGGSPALDATAGSLPSPLNEIYLGSLLGGSSLNGYIRELALFRSRRPNANLQALTS